MGTETKTLIGTVLKRQKNCACGDTKEGFCPVCKTTAKDIVTMEIQDEWKITKENPAPMY